MIDDVIRVFFVFLRGNVYFIGIETVRKRKRTEAGGASRKLGRGGQGGREGAREGRKKINSGER